MRQPVTVLTLVMTTLLASAPSQGAEEPSFAQDMKATIVLHGMPCDQIVDVKRNGDSDYTASCNDGNRYHVFVDAHGRVVVQKI